MGSTLHLKTIVWPLPSHDSWHAPCLLHIHACRLHVGRYPPQPVSVRGTALPWNPPSYLLRLFSSQTFPVYILQHSQTQSFFITIRIGRWNSAPKCRHIKFYSLVTTQKKAYNTLPLFFTLQNALIRFRCSMISCLALLHTVDSGLAICRSLFKKYFKLFKGCVITSNYESEHAWTAFGSKVHCTSGGHLFLEWLWMYYVAHETVML